ncbi:hypothetical protein CB0940_07931 [Cercospora beticola]|uniref:Transcription factor domain-containing protein n=1 Tax=Cercospora beticola TaxID=122368 RepID=A0A2G5HA59_CERBT|nr:hypothetical protein CB0940_07931 [Cercospora beticola]PIA89436.1 hypothetical protein CB0940_07931 [Cercospora beticola]WPB03901.1 hypothetical protein RHO25_008545 [Cercospora beticola]
MVRDAASTAGKVPAGKRSVIVLNPMRRPSLTTRSKFDPELEDIEEPPESDDPAVIRRIVRRQAALASAGRRKATLAAIHQKRSTRRLQHPGHALSSIPYSTAYDGSTHPSEVLPSPGALAIANERFDPFANQAVDFDAIKDSGMLHSLFNVFMAHVAPLLDLRLPTQEDRRLGRRYSWQKELPQMALASPPCFWAVMLAASGQMDSVANNSPAKSMLTLKFRHMTIRSINKRLDASSTGFRNDFGLLIGIAILGSWEHWWGSPEACRAHCDGLRMLRQHFKDSEQPHDLFAQVMTFANTFGSKDYTEPQEPKYAQPLPQIVESRVDMNSGFEWTASRVYLDQRLVRSICSCLEIEKMHSGTERAQIIRELASVILSFNTKPRLKTVFTENDWSRDQDGDRLNLEMHIILQAAGVSLLNFLAGSAKEAGTEDVDVIGMCEEVSDLGRSVVCLPLYDQVLLWALVTVLALSHQAPAQGIEIIRTAAHRLQMQHFVPNDLETYMGAFVFLRSARDDYSRFCTAIQTSPVPITVPGS